MTAAALRLIPWIRPEPPSEAELYQSMADEGLRPYEWSNAPGDVYAVHEHAYHKVIYVIDGSITFGLPGEGGSMTLQSGDRLELPADTPHNARVGPQGVRCLEGHRPT